MIINPEVISAGLQAEASPSGCSDICRVVKNADGTGLELINIRVLNSIKLCDELTVDLNLKVSEECPGPNQKITPMNFERSDTFKDWYSFNMKGQVEVPVINSMGNLEMRGVDPGRFMMAVEKSIVERGPARDTTGEEMVLGIFAVVVTIGVVGTILIKESLKIKAPKWLAGHPQRMTFRR
jgi:hypothetical protein